MLELKILLEMLLAGLLGGVVGFDREQAEKPAGLRTHMLVAAAATLLTNLGPLMAEEHSGRLPAATSDPIRILEAIITAIGFLGAGTILRDRQNGQVEGLTTAASLLFTAGIGISIGLSKFILAIGVTALGLIILRGVRVIVTPKITPADGS